MLPPLPCDQTSVGPAAGGGANQPCSRTPSSVMIQRSSIPGGGGGTYGSGKKISDSSSIGAKSVRLVQLDRRLVHGADPEVQHLDEHREGHREVDVALRDVLVEAL